MPSYVQWFPSNVAKFTAVGPVRAHLLASNQAAGVAARLIQSKQTGTLARDVSRAKPIGPLRSIVGSGLPYAAIEHFGGVIETKNVDRYGRKLLYIRGKRTARSTFGGPITATKRSVVHKGKFYLNGATTSYPQLMIAALKRELPSQGVLF